MNKTPDPKSADFKNLVDLLAVYSEAHHQLEALNVNLNQDMLESVDSARAEYARLQEVLANANAALELIAVTHPEWFAEKKGLKTPYGTVKFTRSTVLEVKNEELSLELIRRDAHGLTLDPENLIRVREELDLEALESLSDEQLKAFKIRRVPKENFSVVPAKLDLGKAVKEAAEKPKTEAA